MLKLAIKGNATRGSEVIALLEMLGGINKYNINVTEENLLYCCREGDNAIIAIYPNSNIQKVFTLEEFEEKFPYKVGDKVNSKYLKNYKIEKMEWKDTNNRVIYKLQGMGWYSAKELQPYKEENYCQVIGNDTSSNGINTSASSINEETMEQIKIDIPNGYEFFGINDDNQVVLAKKQPQYPKTYEECCKELGHPAVIMSDYVLGYKGSLLNSLQKLLTCRDAYWKMAGEEMGLGKPLEPDWSNAAQRKYCIVNTEGNVLKWVQKTTNKILAFPTEEMRDAFYENFKDLIEECKELL